LLKILLAGFNCHLEVLMRKKPWSTSFRARFGNDLGTLEESDLVEILGLALA